MKTKKEIKNPLNEEINIYGAVTTAKELIIETFINFMWGFMGNSIVVFNPENIKPS